jgi:hypothetical protein
MNIIEGGKKKRNMEGSIFYVLAKTINGSSLFQVGNLYSFLEY